MPLTLGGRLIGVFLMFMGIGLVTLLTATVSSVFVEKKIREGKGLEVIKLKDHFIVCGWHSNGEAVIEALIKATAPIPAQIVLINELDEEKINALKYKYEQIQIRFVKGDFTHEGTLRLARIGQARAAIILSDISGNRSLEEADRRIVLATLAIKNINSRVKVCAEMINPENEEHLRRANVDDIILNGEMALLGDSIRTATVAALTGCSLYSIKKEDFEALGEEYPVLGYKLVRNISRILCDYLKKANSDILKLTTALSIALTK